MANDERLRRAINVQRLRRVFYAKAKAELKRWFHTLSDKVWRDGYGNFGGSYGTDAKVAWSEAQDEDWEIRTFLRRQITPWVWSGTSGVEDGTPAVGEGMFSSVSRMREIRMSGLMGRGEETWSGKRLRHRQLAKAFGNG